MSSNVTRDKVLKLSYVFMHMLNEVYPEFEYEREICRTEGLSVYFKRKNFQKGDWTIRISDHPFGNDKFRVRSNYFYLKHKDINDEDKLRTAISYLRWNGRN